MLALPETVFERLIALLTDAVGDHLLGLTVHGSFVAGDFHPGRSDLDFVAVLDTDPDEQLIGVLNAVHDQLGNEFPEWLGHIEVDYVSPGAVRDVLAGADEQHAIARISPGEPLHLVPATTHYLLNWNSAQQVGKVIHGRSAAELLPTIPREAATRTLLDHIKNWPEWVLEMETVGSQAYAVQTICRARMFVETGQQMSKHAAAMQARELMPDYADLITWADAWWYQVGSDDEPTRLPAVIAFVQSTCAGLLAQAG